MLNSNLSRNDLLALPLTDESHFHLSNRTMKRLALVNVVSLKDLATIADEKSLLNIAGFGKTCLKEVKDTLYQYELHIAMTQNDIDTWVNVVQVDITPAA